MNVLLTILVLMLVNSIDAAAQPGGRFGGTFIGAAITTEGIVIASDSRSTFLDEQDRRVAYIDGMQKIYVRQGAAVAVSGLTSIDRELFSSFMKRNDFLLTRTPDEILFGVLVWLPFRNNQAVVLLSAGFVQGQATLCGKPPTLPQTCTRNGYFTSKQSASLRQWFDGLRQPPTPAAAADALKRAIQESAAADVTVGGPISILHIRNNVAPVWLENAPRDNGWTTICDLVGAHRQGRVQIASLTSRAEMDRYLDATCPR